MNIARPIITIGGLHRPSPRERKKKHHPYEEWVKIRHKNREYDITLKIRTKAISDFLRRVIPDMEQPAPSTQAEPPKQLIVPKVETKTSPTPSPFLLALNDDTMKMTSRSGLRRKKKKTLVPEVLSRHKIRYPRG